MELFFVLGKAEVDGIDLTVIFGVFFNSKVGPMSLLAFVLFYHNGRVAVYLKNHTLRLFLDAVYLGIVLLDILHAVGLVDALAGFLVCPVLHELAFGLHVVYFRLFSHVKKIWGKFL